MTVLIVAMVLGLILLALFAAATRSSSLRRRGSDSSDAGFMASGAWTTSASSADPCNDVGSGSGSCDGGSGGDGGGD